MPCIGSTTIPISRRSSPHTCSTSSASWRPSTQIRPATATFAGAAGPATEPDAVIRRCARPRRPPGGAASPAAPRAGTRPASTRSGGGAAGGRAVSRPRSTRSRRRRRTRWPGPRRPSRRHVDLGVGDRPLPIGELVEDVALVGHRLHSSTGTIAARGASHRHGEHTRHHHDRPPTARRHHRHRHRRPRRTGPGRVHAATTTTPHPASPSRSARRCRDGAVDDHPGRRPRRRGQPVRGRGGAAGRRRPDRHDPDAGHRPGHRHHGAGDGPGRRRGGRRHGGRRAP